MSHMGMKRISKYVMICKGGGERTCLAYVIGYFFVWRKKSVSAKVRSTHLSTIYMEEDN